MENLYTEVRITLFFACIFLTLLSCKIERTKNNEARDPKDFFETSKGTKETRKLEKENLYGVWAENEKDDALYVIEKDSLYFIEHMESPILYFINADTLYFDYGDFQTYSIIIKVSNDSLYLKDEYNSEILKLYKR